MEGYKILHNFNFEGRVDMPLFRFTCMTRNGSLSSKASHVRKGHTILVERLSTRITRLRFLPDPNGAAHRLARGARFSLSSPSSV